MIAVVTGAAALAGGVGAANANGNHFHHHGFGFGPRFIISTGYDCGYLFDRWQFTGSRYWKYRYFQCRNGW